MKQIHLLPILILCCFQSYADGIFEGFETGLQDPFNGSSNLTWIGDVGDFEITTAGWPVSPAPDFSGNNSLRALANQELNSTILTDISQVFSSDLKMRWEIFVSGKSTTVTSTRGFSLILFVDSNDIDKIESGAVSGYRIHVCDPVGYQDGIFLEKASGFGWEIIDYIETTEVIKLNQGWNIVVERDPFGNWIWGYSNGVYNVSVFFTESISDSDFTLGLFSGINWYSIASYSSSFGFDNFRVDPYTPNLWKSEAASTVWSNENNWDDGVVPQASSNIQIEAGTNQPIITNNINCGNLTLEAGANLSINNGHTLSVDGNLLLESNTNSTASIIDNGNLNIAGSSIIQRFMKCYDPTANNEYHFLSIPVANHAVENSLIGYYVYPYHEAQNSWTALSSGDQLLKGRGYSVYYSGDTDHCVSFSGIPNTGDQIIPITANNFSATFSTDNWNLIGNPFPSPIDWDLVTKNNIESAIYIWKAESCTYASYVNGVGTNFNDDGIIPAMQGFFVHATSSGNLTISQASRTHNQVQVYLLKNEALIPQLRIGIQNQNYSDECVIRLKNGATEFWDDEFDALKILSEKQDVPQLFTIIDQDIKASVNSLSSTYDHYEIPVVSKINVGGNYKISVSNVSSFTQEFNILLKDIISGDLHEITKDSCYQINLIAGEIEHFVLLLDRKKMDIQEKDENISFNVFQDGKISIDNISQQFMGGVLKVIAIDGKEIYSAEINENSMQFSITQRGACIIKLISSQKVFTEKIIVL